MMCRKQRAVRSQGHQHYSCATAFNECVSGSQLFRLGGQWASDAFPQLSHARFKQIHPAGHVPQAAARGVQRKTGVQMSARCPQVASSIRCRGNTGAMDSRAGSAGDTLDFLLGTLVICPAGNPVRRQWLKFDDWVAAWATAVSTRTPVIG
jgi:hypothetical protein